MEQWINNPWSDESVQGQHTGQGTLAGTWGMHKVKKQKQINVIFFLKIKKREIGRLTETNASSGHFWGHTPVVAAWAEPLCICPGGVQGMQKV